MRNLRLLRACRRRAHIKYTAKLRLEAFTRYGGPICVCCGETNILFLTLDHTKNDGAVHRKAMRIIDGNRKMKGEAGSGWTFYVWLRRNNYPPLDLRVLCYNCNCGRWRNGGVCPHTAST